MNFKTISTKTISDIIDLLEEKDINSELEVDFNNDVCSIKSKYGFHIINTNSYLGEIWLSSCISGPHHFILKDGCWINKKGKELEKIIFAEFDNIIKNNTNK